MARGPSKKKEQSAETIALIKALEFCATAQKDQGLPYQSHIILRSKTAQAYDGVLTTGIGIEFADVNTAAHTVQLLAALKKCKAEHSITQLDNGQLVVRSGAFRAIVQAMNPDDLQSNALWPDNPIAPIDDRLKAGFQALSPLVQESAPHVVTTTLMLQANTMMATDRVLFAEYWHGIDLPPGLVLPKAFLTAVLKCDKKLTQFGYSENSVTFWFEDYSWIKTQRHSEPWPDTSHIFNFIPTVEDIPKKLREAVESVAPFSQEGAVYLNQGEVASHLDNATGATFDCDKLPGGQIFTIKRLLACLDFANKVDWNTSRLGSYFQGDSIRAMLSKRTQ